MIRFPCPACRRGLKARPELAGRRAPCPCGAVVTIPTPNGKSSVTARVLTGHTTTPGPGPETDADGAYRGLFQHKGPTTLGPPGR